MKYTGGVRVKSSSTDKLPLGMISLLLSPNLGMTCGKMLNNTVKFSNGNCTKEGIRMYPISVVLVVISFSHNMKGI